MNKKEMGLRIKEARLQKGFTQSALASRVDISPVYLSDMERGKKMPSINTLIKIAEALETSADYILRNHLTSGEVYVCNDITLKLKGLTPAQRKTAVAILNAYIDNL